MKKWISKLTVGLLVELMVMVLFVLPVSAQMKTFTAAELAEFDGRDGAKSYTSYEGVVYDVTDSTLWKLGEHFGLQAGKDLTADMANAPHGDEVFTGFQQVGVLEGFETAEVEAMEVAPTEEMAAEPMAETSEKPWYASRLRFLGISVLGWTGILLGVFFVFTFGTCFAMPWAQMKLPWVGEKPGEDKLDVTGVHKPWTAIHKYFVWFTVIFGVVHGILGLLQLVGIYL